VLGKREKTETQSLHYKANFTKYNLNREMIYKRKQTDLAKYQVILGIFNSICIVLNITIRRRHENKNSIVNTHQNATLILKQAEIAHINPFNNDKSYRIIESSSTRWNNFPNFTYSKSDCHSKTRNAMNRPCKNKIKGRKGNEKETILKRGTDNRDGSVSIPNNGTGSGQ
jgi:hypothetical protein